MVLNYWPRVVMKPWTGDEFCDCSLQSRGSLEQLRKGEHRHRLLSFRERPALLYADIIVKAEP